MLTSSLSVVASAAVRPGHHSPYSPELSVNGSNISVSVTGDVHTITGGWGDANLPLCVGHEIIGKVIKVGNKVTLAKVGQRVGVGAMIRACMECKNCKSDNENYCSKGIGRRFRPIIFSRPLNLQTDYLSSIVPETYNAPYPDGTIAQGGYASHIRAHEYFTFPIPDSIPSAVAAPMMCAGLTTYSPLRRANIGPGSHVAVIGM